MINYSDEGWQGRNWNTGTINEQRGYAGKIP